MKLSRRALLSPRRLSEALADPSLAQLAAELGALLDAGAREVVFACGHTASASPGAGAGGRATVEVPTLSLVTPGWVLQAAARGAAVRFVECDEEPCRGWQATDVFCGRVLEALAGSAAGAPAEVTLAEPRATAAAVVRLAAPDAAAVLEDAASPLGILRLAAGRCTLCGACVAACPAGALGLEESSEETVLWHDPAGCAPCARCVAACPEDALAVRAGLDLGALLAGRAELERSPRGSCAACGRPLPAAATLRRLEGLLGELRPGLGELCSDCVLAGRNAE